MKLSISVTNYSWAERAATSSARTSADLARQVDDAGIDTLWVADHLLQMDPNAAIDEPMLEAYTTLGFLAAATSDVQLGTMVTWATIRPPALLVKTVTTLDVLSGGRAWLGVGAGYQGDEAAMTGLPFQPTAGAVRADWRSSCSSPPTCGTATARPFDGPHHRLEQPISEPPPISPAAGAHRRHGRAAHPSTRRPLRRRLQPLRHPRRRRPHCDASSTSSPTPATSVGSDRDEIEITLSSRLAPTARPRSSSPTGAASWPAPGSTTSCSSPPARGGGGDLDVILDAVEPLRAVA